MLNLLKPLGPSRAPANQSPKSPLKAQNWLPTPKIGFQNSKLASNSSPNAQSGQNLLPKPNIPIDSPQSPKFAPKAQNPKLASGAQNLLPEPKIGSKAQNWPPKPKIGPQSPKLAQSPKSQNLLLKPKLAAGVHFDPNEARPCPPSLPALPKNKNVVPKNKTFRSKLSVKTFWDPNPIQFL